MSQIEHFNLCGNTKSPSPKILRSLTSRDVAPHSPSLVPWSKGHLFVQLLHRSGCLQGAAPGWTRGHQNNLQQTYGFVWRWCTGLQICRCFFSKEIWDLLVEAVLKVNYEQRVVIFFGGGFYWPDSKPSKLSHCFLFFYRLPKTPPALCWHLAPLVPQKSPRSPDLWANPPGSKTPISCHLPDTTDQSPSFLVSAGLLPLSLWTPKTRWWATPRVTREGHEK